tara:strand:- start:1014 stop:1274 length:261 start_codon:yes stop_codon:yes gene_type:complete
MKKILLGLVIVLMMTGSGYADLDRDECKYLKTSAEAFVTIGKILDDRLTEAVNEKKNIDYAPVTKEVLDNIKNAHYYAVTYSALCD